MLHLPLFLSMVMRNFMHKHFLNKTFKNSLRTDGSRHPTRTYSDVAVFGTLPPKPISYSELCPPVICPQLNCEEYRCNNGFLHHDIEIRQLQFKGFRFPGILNRTFGMFVATFYCLICRGSFTTERIDSSFNSIKNKIENRKVSKK